VTGSKSFFTVLAGITVLLDTASTRVAVLRRSDDRGGAVPPGQVHITAALMGVAILIVGGVVAVVNKGINPWELFAWFVSIGVLGVGLFFFAAAATARTERIAAQRLRQVAWRMGPVLREWLTVEHLTDDDLQWWCECEDSGVTTEQAQRWVDQGLPYPLLVAAPGLDVEERSVRALAALMQAAGAWDGSDRRVLVELIGFHFELAAPGGYHPVLDRWLALPSETVRERVATAVMRADIDQAPFAPEFRVRAATQAVLYDLEQEYGIDGYRLGPQRPVHPSWLVGSGA